MISRVRQDEINKCKVYREHLNSSCRQVMAQFFFRTAHSESDKEVINLEELKQSPRFEHLNNQERADEKLPEQQPLVRPAH